MIRRQSIAMQLQMIANNHKHFLCRGIFFLFFFVGVPSILFSWHLTCSFLWPYVSAFFYCLIFLKNSFWLLFFNGFLTCYIHRIQQYIYTTIYHVKWITMIHMIVVLSTTWVVVQRHWTPEISHFEHNIMIRSGAGEKRVTLWSKSLVLTNTEKGVYPN